MHNVSFRVPCRLWVLYSLIIECDNNHFTCTLSCYLIMSPHHHHYFNFVGNPCIGMLLDRYLESNDSLSEPIRSLQIIIGMQQLCWYTMYVTHTWNVSYQWQWKKTRPRKLRKANYKWEVCLSLKYRNPPSYIIFSTVPLKLRSSTKLWASVVSAEYVDIHGGPPDSVTDFYSWLPHCNPWN